MKGPISILAIFCVAFAASKNLANRYDDFKVFRVTIADDAAANFVAAFRKGYLGHFILDTNLFGPESLQQKKVDPLPPLGRKVNCRNHLVAEINGVAQQ